MKPKSLILRTAGTNCDWETVAAFEKAGADAERVHVNRIVENPGLLDYYQILTIPGGFTYGDDIASGAVLANELMERFGEQLCRFRDRGKLILGICNGFQVLARTGLLPGFEGGKAEANLDRNDSGKFEDRWAYLKPDGEKCVFTGGIGDAIYLPVAHGEGKFVAPYGVMERLKKDRQVVFRYAGENGNPAGRKYPLNPNGSLDDIAGICDPTGRVFGLMPHPERHYMGLQHPRWTREGLRKHGDGLAIFRNAVDYAKG
jgi:phosphoribosylformylglycinamidine synthase